MIPTKRLITCALLVAIAALPLLSVAQDIDEEDIEEAEEELRKELKEIEKEIEEQNVFLREKQNETVSLERDLQILDAGIRKTELSIDQRNHEIGRLEGEIGNREVRIVELTDELAREKESLAQLIRRTNELDHISLVEVILSEKNISEFFEDLDAFEAIKLNLQLSFREVETTREENKEEKVALEGSKESEFLLKQAQLLEKEKLVSQEDQKEFLHSISKTEEQKYELVIAAKQKDAAELRARLFRLRGAGPIPFGEAVALASRAGKQTGVRAALILGVLQQETKLGENVGQCNLPEDPPKYKWYSIMPGPNDKATGRSSRDDQSIYQDIMARLGFDPEDMPLSCQPGYGWGGAMGPAQFIPSTWILFEEKVSALTGNVPPNPWAPEDAFMASALLLKDNGAAQGGYTAERLATLRYFAGWGNAEKPAYAFYGDSVMQFASEFQSELDFLADN